MGSAYHTLQTFISGPVCSTYTCSTKLLNRELILCGVLHTILDALQCSFPTPSFLVPSLAKKLGIILRKHKFRLPFLPRSLSPYSAVRSPSLGGRRKVNSVFYRSESASLSLYHHPPSSWRSSYFRVESDVFIISRLWESIFERGRWR